MKCTRSIRAGGLHLAYVFRRGGALEAQVDPTIELTDYHLTLPGLRESESRALLKAAERSAFGKDGCGIEWSKPPTRENAESGTYELIYRGNVCNCQGRVKYQDGTVTGLVFRTAC